jgi:nitroreductase
MMDLLEGIYTRRSIRQFTDQPVTKEDITEIIKAGTWAPSGLNNQPWRFVIIESRDILSRVAELSHYKKVIRSAPVCIAVFVDKNAMYDETKDHQAMGACIQNMLLAAHALGLGAVWLGEILKNGKKVRLILELSEEMDLMALVAVGYPVSRDQVSSRKDVSDVIIKNL